MDPASATTGSGSTRGLGRTGPARFAGVGGFALLFVRGEGLVGFADVGGSFLRSIRGEGLAGLAVLRESALRSIRGADFAERLFLGAGDLVFGEFGAPFE